MTVEVKIEAYLTRRIGEIRTTASPQDRSFQKSVFMLETSTFAEAALMTHGQRFDWNDRMLREAP